MKTPLRILHLEDEPDFSELVSSLLHQDGIEAEVLLVCSRQDYETALRRENVDLILADYSMPGYNGLKALEAARLYSPHVPFLMISGAITEHAGVNCLKSGATDYVLKQNVERLAPAVRRAVEEAEERANRRRIETELARRENYFRALTENTSDLFLIVDASGIILYASPSVQRVLGYETQEVVGGRSFDLVHPEDLQTVREAFEAGLAQPDMLVRLEFRARHKNGDWCSFEAVGQNRLRDAELQGLLVNLRDVSDRKKTERSLRESEQQYRLIFDGNPIPMWVFDQETLAFLEVNDAAVRHYGFSREEFLGMTLREIRPSNETPTLMEYLHRLVPKGTVPQALAGVWQHRKKDGTTIDVEIKWAPLSFHGRTASLTMANDVTGRLRMEQQTATLSKLGQKLSGATSASEAANIIRSVADELFKWDAFTLNLYSQSDDQFRTLLSIDTTVGGQRFDATSASVIRAPSPMSRRVIEHGAELILREEPVVMPPEVTPVGDVTRPSASLMLVPIRNSTRVLGVLSIQSYTPRAYTAKDLAILQTLADHCGGALERIHAEQALKQSELLFHSVWTNSIDGMRLTDANGIIAAANGAFCQTVGIEPDKLQGMSFTEVLAPSESPDALLQNYKTRFARRQGLPPMDKPVKLHNGNTVHLEDRSSFVELPGQPPLVLTVVRDVTAQKRLEDQFRHAQKMEAIGQLAGGVAHDFNNILTVIHGHASLILGADDRAESSVRSAEQILQAAERAAGLTRQLLTFSRRQVLQSRRVDLNEVVGNMTKMLGRILGEDMTLQLNYAPQSASVNADPGMIEQVLLNLVVNSRDAMPQGGVLNVRIGFAEVGIEEAAREPDGLPGSFVCLTVSDNGCGIPPENLRRVFEPFFTTKQIGKGTGLGLATVYGIVKQHQGWIQIQSEVGQGTRIRVYLPRLAAADVPAEAPPEFPPIKGGHETILVVEDEGPVRELVCHLLERHGYQILQADSGVKALEIWQEAKNKVDLLLTDLVMPDRMNGRELAEKLWSDRPTLPVIFTSGYSADVVGRDFVTRAGLQYLQKPYHPHKLALVVRDCLDAKN